MKSWKRIQIKPNCQYVKTAAENNPTVLPNYINITTDQVWNS